jgi:sRNA-binding regulator protein Hfq
MHIEIRQLQVKINAFKINGIKKRTLVKKFSPFHFGHNSILNIRLTLE